MAERGATASSGSWMGFLISSYLVLGLIGGMAIYGAQIPLERLAAHDAAMAQLQAASDDAARERLRPLLGDTAERLLRPGGAPQPDLDARIGAERHRQIQDFAADAAQTGKNLRLGLALFTAATGLFGALAFSIAARPRA